MALPAGSDRPLRIGSFRKGDEAMPMEDDPKQAVAKWYALGCREANSGNAASAMEHFEQAARLDPNNPAILLDLGNACADTGKNLRAAESYRKVLQIDPNCGSAWNNLGNLFFHLGDMGSAIACYSSAVRLMPTEAIALYSLGRALCATGKAGEALEHLSRACDRDPGRADTWTALGKAHQHLGHWDQALNCFDHALALAPDSAEPHVDRAVVLLNQGNFREGWREYEHRWGTESFRVYSQRSFGKPEWKGEPIEGKRILLHSEQGFGDAIQFARFIPAVSAHGAEVFLEIRAPMKDLFGELVAPGHLIVAGQPLPNFDFHCSFLSLAGVLGVELASIPGHPYLRVPPAMVQSAAAALQLTERERALLRVALVWKGNPSHRWNAMRSVTPIQLAPLARVAGIQWYSLQNGAASKEMKDWPKSFPIMTLPGEYLDGFQRMAAVIQAVDLVISVDTAQAHLAGALGKPVWLLLPLFYEWRWHSHLDNSPWYPSARLFRQRRPGEWVEAIEELAEALALLAGAGTAHRTTRTIS
jgi:tetratricopeptide (TPR) repeat protein